MTHRFPIKEIALQAGLGTATVDRVLNDRPNVSPQTRQRVHAAIAELKGQETQLSARGRRLFIDFVVEAPNRFTDEIKHAAETILPTLGAGVFRPRFIFQEVMTEDDVLAILRRIAKRGSHGVCLKARDLPRICDAVNALTTAGIPVVTLATDIPNSSRTAYVGLDNANAGRTAAYLMTKFLGGQAGTVLTTKSQHAFFGEEERDSGFREVMKRDCPDVELIDASGGAGVPWHMIKHVAEMVSDVKDLKGVYSMGGGNEAILQILADQGHRPQVFIAHDLDKENKRLLEQGVLTFVLYHDLRADIRNAFLAFAQHHRLMQLDETPHVSDIQIVTPFNPPHFS
jgi:LacI family transcriptional regulator, galactose operon repressor